MGKSKQAECWMLTKPISCHSHQKCFSRNTDDLLINGSRISEVNGTKFLGVIIENEFNWSPHIMYISKKVAKGIGIILKARKVFVNETILSLYYTFVYPYLNYCIHVWGKTYDSHLHHLIVSQNKVIRIISGVLPRTNVDNLYVMHDILSVKRLYSYNAALLMYKYSNQLLPDVFDIFSKLADVHEYNTRNASTQHVYVCFQRTNYRQKPIKLLWCSYLELCSWQCWLKLCNWLLKNLLRLFLFSNDGIFTWLGNFLMHYCISINHVKFVDVYTCICMCMCPSWGTHSAWKEEHWIKSSSTLHCFCSALQKKQSLWYNWYWGTKAMMASRLLCHVLYISCMIVL